MPGAMRSASLRDDIRPNGLSPPGDAAEIVEPRKAGRFLRAVNSDSNYDFSSDEQS